MNSRDQVSKRPLYIFLLKNGIISMIVSFIIVQSLIAMLNVDIRYQGIFPIFFFVLIINTIFFMIIFIQERKLRSHQEQLLAVIKNSNQGIFILDRNKTVISVNEAGRNLLCLPNDRVINFCEVCSSYLGANKICDVSKCFLTIDQENPVEILVKGKEKNPFPVLATISYYTTPKKEQGIVVSMQKVTKKRKEEHEKIGKMITQSIFHAQEKERKLISRELHDGIGQSLFGILLETDIIKSVLKDEKEFHLHLEKLQQMVTQTIEDVRNLSSELRPSTLDDHGLIITLKNFILELGTRFGFQINFTYKGSKDRLPSSIETALYRIAQEALINVAKYAAAERIDVVIERFDEKISLSITDFGKGFELNPSNRRGVGIYSMEERTMILGGDFNIISEIGKGTQIQVTIPVNQGD